MTEPSELPFLFKGGYCLVAQAALEDLIHRAINEPIPAYVLRCWCGYLDMKRSGGLTLDSPLMLDAELRRTMTAKSLGIRQVGTRYLPSHHRLFMSEYLDTHRGDYEQGDYHVKIPREVLRYLCFFGTKSEIIFVFIACMRVMRRKKFKFRLNQVKAAAELGISRASLSRAVKRLIKNGVIHRIKSPMPFVRAHGQQYQFIATIGVKRTEEYKGKLDIDY